LEKIMTNKSELGLTVQLKNTTMPNAIVQVTEALKVEGFGVLTEIDVQATLKKKIDVDFRPYVILGACNPKLAHRALTAAPEVGLLLPCNVTVSQVDPNTIEVSLVDPIGMLDFVKRPELASVAAEAGERLARVAAALGKEH
jgi:uncharacterized protein (DUF302 family)